MAGRGNPLVRRQEILAELEAELEVVKAKIASTKANIQVEKAEVKSNQAAVERNLTGNRDVDGNLIVDKPSGMRLSGVEVEEEERGSIRDVTDAQPRNLRAAAQGMNISTEEMIEAGIPVQQSIVQQVETDDRERRHNISGVELPLEEDDDASIRDVTDKRPMNLPGIDVGDGGVEEEMVTEKQIAEPEVADEPEKDTDGRRKATEIENLRGEKPGWEMADDANFWSVNEKDPYWKTQEGYNEAIDLYGKKPSFLKEKDIGTLVYNPSTGEYEEVEQEEFEDLSRPAVSSDIKKLFG